MSRWEVLWGESWVNIRMMLTDAPQYHPPKTKGGDDNEPAEEMTDDELIEFADKM